MDRYPSLYGKEEEMPAFDFRQMPISQSLMVKKGILSFELSFSLKEEKADKMQLKRFSSGLRAIWYQARQ